MEKQMYIVSFGDSEQYKLVIPGDEHRPHEIKHIEDGILKYLDIKYPSSSTKYYATAKVERISPEEYYKYESYPVLDADAIAQIKKVLSTGIEVQDDTERLDSNDANF